MKLAGWGFVLLSIGGLLMGQAAWVGADGTGLKKAVFGAGCFWGVEKLFWDVPGVVSTQVGYAGGETKNPTYEKVCTGLTGHAEAVEITYDPARVRYETLLEIFWKSHNPTTPNQQGNDIGTQYRSAILYTDAEQKKLAEKSKRLLEQSGIFKQPIFTEIVEAGPFYPAETYHQKYLKKNPHGYCSLPPPSAKVAKALASLYEN